MRRRKKVLILVTMGLGVMILGGVAQAKDITGTNGDDNPLRGTDSADFISGLDGADYIVGEGGADGLYGGSGDDEVHGNAGRDHIEGELGSDEMFGGPSDDTISAVDGSADYVNCGSGSDIVNVDEIDIVNENCESATPTATATPAVTATSTATATPAVTAQQLP
jgi:hypothetical protein